MWKLFFLKHLQVSIFVNNSTIFINLHCYFLSCKANILKFILHLARVQDLFLKMRGIFLVFHLSISTKIDNLFNLCFVIIFLYLTFVFHLVIFKSSCFSSSTETIRSWKWFQSEKLFFLTNYQKLPCQQRILRIALNKVTGKVCALGQRGKSPPFLVDRTVSVSGGEDKSSIVFKITFKLV